jgi:hypothetical protein
VSYGRCRKWQSQYSRPCAGRVIVRAASMKNKVKSFLSPNYNTSLEGLKVEGRCRKDDNTSTHGWDEPDVISFIIEWAQTFHPFPCRSNKRLALSAWSLLRCLVIDSCAYRLRTPCEKRFIRPPPFMIYYHRVTSVTAATIILYIFTLAWRKMSCHKRDHFVASNWNVLWRITTI